jgi:hypothetical protein
MRMRSAAFALTVLAQQLCAQDQRYVNRASDCRTEPPPGVALQTRRTDTGIRTNGYVAERVVSSSADASALSGGEIVVCTEYGRVEIVDSDDDHVRVQVRGDGFGEGAEIPAEAARRVIDATDVIVHITAHEGRLHVRVWHPRLDFTPSGQPAWVSVRIQVPNRGAYRVATEAFHGVVAIRRLTLGRSVLIGRVGEKLKGIDGFNGGTELYDVTLAGDVEISNPMAQHGAPVIARVRVASSCNFTVQTFGDIRVAVQPHPELGVRAISTEHRSGKETRTETRDYAAKPIKVEVRAISGGSGAQVVSVPSAPLR